MKQKTGSQKTGIKSNSAKSATEKIDGISNILRMVSGAMDQDSAKNAETTGSIIKTIKLLI